MQTFDSFIWKLILWDFLSSCNFSNSWKKKPRIFTFKSGKSPLAKEGVSLAISRFNLPPLTIENFLPNALFHFNDNICKSGVSLPKILLSINITAVEDDFSVTSNLYLVEGKFSHTDAVFLFWKYVVENYQDIIFDRISNPGEILIFQRFHLENCV